MMQSKFIEEITAKLSELAAQSPLKDFEKNSRAMLSSMFAKMDLVTREEFDVQSQVLLRTREKLAELEAKLAALEKSSGDS
jgi:ubiquinone biosynthesis accessory factor UbiK